MTGPRCRFSMVFLWLPPFNSVLSGTKLTSRCSESQPGNPNQEFVFADVGNDEYLILNLGSGTYMTANSMKEVPFPPPSAPYPTHLRLRWESS